jgi:predicted amidophosphoribosyltransferase
MKLGAAARARNPQGAFQLNPSRLAALGKIQHVMIIDDVMTTGATLQAISTLLQEAGIPFISFGVVARTP